jgi:hypothetical protein
MQSAHTLQLEAIVQRLERLERANRCWKRLAVTAIFLLGLLGLTAATSQQETPVVPEVRAQAFVLVDARGTVLARLGRLPHGPIGLGFYEHGKQSRLLLSVEDNGAASVSLFGRDGHGGALLAVSNTGAASLRLLDINWKNRIALATWPNGAPFLQLSDRQGKDRILLGYTDLKVMATGEIVERSNPSLLLFDRNETILWRAP